MPDIIPQKDKELVRLLRAARHAQRYPATDTKRGRPSKWKREDLFRVVASLGDILERETSSHVSFASFVDHYLRLSDFPTDVLEALAKEEINLFEAEQLARVIAGRLGVTTSQAKRTRTELLSSHLQTKASGERLRRRVNELLRASKVEAGDISTELPEDLEDFDPYDPTHLFWEQIKQLGFAFRDIRREDVSDEEIEEMLKASEPILAILTRIRRRKEGAAKRLKI
jgi:signal transduction histidine kinase